VSVGVYHGVILFPNECGGLGRVGKKARRGLLVSPFPSIQLRKRQRYGKLEHLYSAFLFALLSCDKFDGNST
jgi:hypothetical protein